MEPSCLSLVRILYICTHKLSVSASSSWFTSQLLYKVGSPYIFPLPSSFAHHRNGDKHAVLQCPCTDIFRSVSYWNVRAAPSELPQETTLLTYSQIVRDHHYADIHVLHNISPGPHGYKMLGVFSLLLFSVGLLIRGYCRLHSCRKWTCVCFALYNNSDFPKGSRHHSH